MSNSSSSPFIIASVEISSLSAIYLQKGHPWVTQDHYTKRFPVKAHLLQAFYHKRPYAWLLHDPEHPHIKARLWTLCADSNNQQMSEELFLNIFGQRLSQAFEKRKSFLKESRRENHYLLFGEGDDLPGLFLQQLGSTLIVQFFSHFWERFGDNKIISLILQSLKNHLQYDPLALFIQKRGKQTEHSLRSYLLPHRPPIGPEPILVKELHNQFALHLDSPDFGLYTDMASMREMMDSEWKKKAPEKCLNLFSYTGAFDLLALSHGSEVDSVDLSPQHLQWLKQNLDLNSLLPSRSIHLHQLSVEKALTYFKQQNRSFDTIICDPPPVLSLKGKTYSSMQFYQYFGMNCLQLLQKRGILWMFLNTHKIPLNTFVKNMKKLIYSQSEYNYSCEVLQTTSWDRPQKGSFPEGHYLKCLKIQRLS
jgi:23S rRNA (cytosine1962-C5)-methyltransferase